MIVRDPAIEERSEQPYVGLRAQIPMRRFRTFIPTSIERVSGWLGQHGIAPAGAPFMRLWVVDMPGLMDVEIGVPTTGTIEEADGLAPGTLPAGRYATLVYRDVKAGIKGNAALLDWISAEGARQDPKGEAFAARYETFLSGPQDGPDPANWDTEVAIKLKD